MREQIKFITTNEYSGLIPEPIPAYREFPKWYSDLPRGQEKFVRSKRNPRLISNEKQNRNVTNCPGITDFLKQGYLIPAWCDIVVRQTPDGKYVVQQLYDSHLADNLQQQEYKTHDPSQYPTMPEEDLPRGGEWLKLFAPWMVKTKPGISVLVTNPIWHRDTRFTSATGVFHSDASPLVLNWMFEWNIDIPNKFTQPEKIDDKLQIIKMGTPLIQIIPFKRQKYKSSIEYVSEQEASSLQKQFLRNTHISTTGGRCPYTSFRSSLNSLFNFR